MYFEFEKLDVYQLSLDFLVKADKISTSLPKGRAYLKDQLQRASHSILSNIAEGVGEYAPKEKARFYRIARRSALETASHLLVIDRLSLYAGEPLCSGLKCLPRIIAMLTKMIIRVLERTRVEP